MKFMRFVNRDIAGQFTLVRKRINIGDNIQSLAIKNLYQYCGIDEKNILEVPYTAKELDTDEEVIAVIQGHFSQNMSMSFINYHECTPCFIGFALMDIDLMPSEIKYFKQYEPIICRDEYTTFKLHKYGIAAYTGGCLSLTFSKREETIKGSTVFFIDTPASLHQYIPQDILDQSEFLSHVIPLDPALSSASDFELAEKEAIARMERYKNEAKLVVSSRLHCLCPCMAMGIPVIAVQNNFSYRFSFIDRYIPLYTPDEFKDIDWRPSAIDVQEERSQLLEIGRLMLEGKHVNQQCLKSLDRIYSNRNKVVYFKNIKSQLRKLKKYVAEDMDYIIWGVGAGGNGVYECVNEVFPKANLVAAVDEFISGKFGGVDIIRSDRLAEYNNAYIFITTLSGEKEALRAMRLLRKKKVRDFLFLHENRYATDLDDI